VLLAILPCAGLCGWVAVRQSVAYRESIERRCERVIGLPLRIGRIEHVRPHALRLHDCRLSSATGSVVLAVPVIEVESSASEVRLKLESLNCGPEQARVLAGLATQWLRQPVRFPMNCVIDVDDLSWRMRSQPASGPGRSIRSNGLRVECVAANSSRAVRVRREAGAGLAADEIRVMVDRSQFSRKYTNRTEEEAFQNLSQFLCLRMKQHIEDDLINGGKREMLTKLEELFAIFHIHGQTSHEILYPNDPSNSAHCRGDGKIFICTHC